MEKEHGGEALTVRSAEVQGVPATASAVAVLKLMGGLARLAAQFATDPQLENEGTWMTAAEGVRIKVRAQQSDTARKIAKGLIQQYRAIFAAGADMTTAQNDDLEVELCALALVTDWEGVTDDEEKPIACTDIYVREVMKMLPHLRRQVVAYASSLENYRKAPVPVAP